MKDVDLVDEYAAYAWEEAEKAAQENEDDWYNTEEGVYDEYVEQKKIYET